MSTQTSATVVLAYHSIHAVEPGIDAPDVIASPQALERDVRTLLDAGYRFLTADDLVTETGGGQPAGRTALVTFDDGWLDGLTVAAPMLSRLGVRATFFLCPGLWGNHDPRMGEAGHVLTAEDARGLAAAGMDLGAHSMTHPDLRTLGDAELQRELADSRAAVEALTGRPCRSLAYPFGLHDARVQRAVADGGFDLAFTYEPGPWRPFAAPRIPAPLSDQYAAA